MFRLLKCRHRSVPGRVPTVRRCHRVLLPTLLIALGLGMSACQHVKKIPFESVAESLQLIDNVDVERVARVRLPTEATLSIGVPAQGMLPAQAHEISRCVGEAFSAYFPTSVGTTPASSSVALIEARSEQAHFLVYPSVIHAQAAGDAEAPALHKAELLVSVYEVTTGQLVDRAKVKLSPNWQWRYTELSTKTLRRAADELASSYAGL